MTTPTFLVGAYTADMGGEALGIAALGTLPDGSLENLGLAAAADSPSYLAASGDLVYAAAEATGRIEVFRRRGRIDLEHVGGASSGGVAPCHVARYGDTVVAANYVDGRLGVLAAAGGTLETVQVLDASGSGPHAAQDGPHAHATIALADGTVLSADLGADRVHVHSRVGAERDGRGSLERTSSVELPEGTGPRDFLAAPSGYLYVLGELGLTVLVLERTGDDFAVVASVVLPGAEPGDHAAALTISGDGRFVYAGLRGSNRISVLAVLDGGRLLGAVTSIAAEGDWPRHHVIVGDVMHVAHERSSSVASFSIPENGIPALIGPPIRVFSPIFLLPL
jgi:6-phosphogluconolactonase (cycloisomerase 2 family)